MASVVDFFPLKGSFSDSVKERLCTVLFRWPACSDCHNTGRCVKRVCVWRGFGSLAPFFEFYRTTTAWNLRQNLFDGPEAIKCHDDMLNILKYLMDKPNDSRTDMLQGYYASCTEAPDYRDQVRAFSLAFRIRTMVQCSLGSSPLTSWRPGFEPAVWEGDKSQLTFLASAFPIREAVSLSDEYGATMRFQLAAKRLAEILTIQGTDDWRKHILLDRDRKILYVYHHTSFLKCFLRASRHNNNCDALEKMLRQLAIETIESIQRIFFPLDLESRKQLRILISKGFDPDTAECYPDDYRRADEQNVVYRHWGSRLIQLHEFIKKESPPRGFWGWCRKWSGSEQMMVLAFLALLVGTTSMVQSWVTYRNGFGNTEHHTAQSSGAGSPQISDSMRLKHLTWALVYFRDGQGKAMI